MPAANGIAVTPYSPVAGGLLSGKYLVPGAQGRFVNKQDVESPVWRGMIQETAARYARFCIHPLSTAVVWIHPAATAPIIGGTQRRAAAGVARVD